MCAHPFALDLYLMFVVNIISNKESLSIFYIIFLQAIHSSMENEFKGIEEPWAETKVRWQKSHSEDNVIRTF